MNQLSKTLGATVSKLLVFSLFTINILFAFILSIKLMGRLAGIRKYHTYEFNGYFFFKK